MPIPIDMGLLSGLPASTIVLYLVLKEVLAHKRRKANGGCDTVIRLDGETRDLFKEITRNMSDACGDIHEIKGDVAKLRDDSGEIKVWMQTGK